jgi:hypothetical protein
MPRPLPDWLPDEEASSKEAELRQIIKEVMREQRVTRRMLAQETTIKESRLQSIFDTGSRMSVLELLTIAICLGYDVDLCMVNPKRFDPSD